MAIGWKMFIKAAPVIIESTTTLLSVIGKWKKESTKKLPAGQSVEDRISRVEEEQKRKLSFDEDQSKILNDLARQNESIIGEVGRIRRLTRILLFGLIALAAAFLGYVFIHN